MQNNIKQGLKDGIPMHLGIFLSVLHLACWQ